MFEKRSQKNNNPEKESNNANAGLLLFGIIMIIFFLTGMFLALFKI